MIWTIGRGAVLLMDFTTHPEHPVYALITKYLRAISPHQALLYLFRWLRQIVARMNMSARLCHATAEGVISVWTNSALAAEETHFLL